MATSDNHLPPLPSSGEFSDRRFERAVQHVGLHWFPVNPHVLEHFIRGLEASTYDGDPKLLLHDLKSDFALFTLCVRELLVVAQREKAPLSVTADPAELVRWGGCDRIHAILTSETGVPRSHNLLGAEPMLLERLKDTSIIAATSEVLSSQKSLNSETAFCHSLVRQIGLNLIAWNYASLYARIVASLASTSLTLDDALSRELGFSPSMLAMRFLRPPLGEHDPESIAVRQSWRTYDSLCEIGEALTRANSPQTYPSADADWIRANEVIQRTVGPSGMALIRQRASESTAAYRAILPATFVSLAHFNPEDQIRGHRQEIRATENHFLRQCPAPIQTALRSIYSDMPRGSVDRTVLGKLVKDVIPQCGYTGGCIFLVDPSTMTLVPRTIIGRPRMRHLTAVNVRAKAGQALAPLIGEVISTRLHSSLDPVTLAFESDQPIVQRSNSDDDNAGIGLYYCLGVNRKIGVIYLEVPEKQYRESGPQMVKVAKAIARTLCDALFVE